MIHFSDATKSPAVEQMLRAGLLGALAYAAFRALDERTISSGTSVQWPEDTTDIQKLNLWSIPGSVEGTRNHPDDRSIATDCVLASVQPDEIIAALSLGGCRDAADRIDDLNKMTSDGFPDEPAIVLASLRELALFLLSQRQFVDPEIGLSPGGLLLAEWASAKRGVLAMKFLPDGMIQFAGVSPAGNSGSRLRVNGVLPKDRALEAVQAFLPSLNVPDAPHVIA